jgi:hypothetical protein
VLTEHPTKTFRDSFLSPAGLSTCLIKDPRTVKLPSIWGDFFEAFWRD